MRLRQIVQAANFNRFHRAGLSATQFMTLNLIPTQGTTLSELARSLNLSPATVHQTVNSLEDRGLLRRAPSRTDARKTDLFATAEGEVMQNAASSEFRQSMAVLFSALAQSEKDGLLAGLERMVELGERPRDEVQAIEPTIPRGAAAARAKRSSRRSPPP